MRVRGIGRGEFGWSVLAVADPFWSTPSIQYGNHATFSLAQFTWSIRMTAS